MANHSDPIQITFGTELEFLVPFNYAVYAPRVGMGELLQLWDAKDSRTLAFADKLKRFVRLDIILALRAGGLLVNDYHTPGHHMWTVSSDGSVKPGENDIEANLTGNAAEEMFSYDCDALGYADVEVKSRVALFLTDSLAEVYTAVEMINLNFPAIVNETTGLHVHVGNLDLGFPLQTVKNAVTFFTVFEKQFNQLHPTNRIGNDYCALPSASFDREERTPWQIARKVHRLNTIEELVELMGTDEDQVINHNKCYNFNNLQYGLEGKKTIEFRQHEGTLDPSAITKWIKLTCTIIGVAHQSNGNSFMDLIADASNKPDLTIVDLLREMHLVALVNYYQERLYIHPIEELEDNSTEE
ncbi:hypothetical protein MMC06_005801 [Schaereria dolodes]|nr:hypothetical protein [Schaereria dolodes]